MSISLNDFDTNQPSDAGPFGIKRCIIACTGLLSTEDSNLKIKIENHDLQLN